MHPDKIIRSFDDTEKKDEWIEDCDLPHFLGDTVKIEEGVTFGRFMNLLKASPQVYQAFFHVELGGSSLEAYFDDMDNDGEDYDRQQIHSVIVSWECDIWHFERGDVPQLEIGYHFSGLGPETKDSGPLGKEGEDISWAIDFTPLWQLKYLPLILKKEFHIYREDCYAGPVKGHKDLGEVCRDFCLQDVIGAILFEIAFYGLPEARNAKIEELEQRVEDVKEGRVKTIPIEDVFKDDEKKRESESETGSGLDC